jgi:hypothetical protein
MFDTIDTIGIYGVLVTLILRWAINWYSERNGGNTQRQTLEELRELKALLHEFWRDTLAHRRRDDR